MGSRRTATYFSSSREIHSSEEFVGSVENESSERLYGVSNGSIPGGGAEAVIAPEIVASSSASAKSWMFLKRSWGSLESALTTTCSTGAEMVDTSSRRG